MQLFKRISFSLLLALGLSIPAVSRVYAEKFADFETDQGCNFHLQLPIVFHPTLPSRAWSSLTDFSLSTYNMLNVAVHSGRYTTNHEGRRVFEQGIFPKDENHIATNFKLINELGYGFVALQEIENGKSLELAVKKRLEDRFQVFTFAGNDPKHNQTSILIPRDFPGTIQFDSHAHHYWHPSDPILDKTPRRLHLRDVVGMVVRKLDAPKKSSPAMIVILLHNKSQRDAEGDPRSAIYANAQARDVLWIKSRYEQQYGKGVPIAIMGDFNRNLRSREMDILFTGRAGLVNALDEAPTASRRQKPVTHYFFDRHGRPQHTQLDGVLMNPAFLRLLKDARVLSEGPAPTTQEERNERSSDHSPLETVSDISHL